MPAAYMLADIVVFGLLEPEAFGRVCGGTGNGRQVIASITVAPVRQLLKGKQAGSPARRRQSFAKTIDAVLAKSEVDRKKISERAKSNIQDNFSNESMCERTLDVYNDVLSLKPSAVGKPLTPGSS